jgi:hypothetical protein
MSWISCTSTGGNNEALLCRSRDRRAAIGKGSNARQAAIRQTGHRGASEQEREGKEEAQISHLTVSGCGFRRCPPFVAAVITIRCFRMSARKREMVSSDRRIVSWAATGRNTIAKTSIISNNSIHYRPVNESSFNGLQHDPEKWAPVFRKDHAQSKR